jgi:hypothetical protein
MEADKLQHAPEGCWALCLGDCGEGMTGEHLVSEGLFQTNDITVQGFPWCLDTAKKIGLASLVANILCKKHNNALNELDTAASDAFKVFREAVHLNHVRQKLKRQPAWNVKRFTIDGPRLERWFLKTLINISFGGQWDAAFRKRVFQPPPLDPAMLVSLNRGRSGASGMVCTSIGRGVARAWSRTVASARCQSRQDDRQTKQNNSSSDEFRFAYSRPG